MVCDSGVTCDFSFFALKLSYSSIHIEKKKRQLQLSRVTLKLRAVKFRGQCENSRRKSIFFFCCHLRVRANGVSMMQADFRLIVNVLPLVLLTFKHTSLSSFTVLPVLLSDHPPFH